MQNLQFLKICFIWWWDISSWADFKRVNRHIPSCYIRDKMFILVHLLIWFALWIFVSNGTVSSKILILLCYYILLSYILIVGKEFLKTFFFLLLPSSSFLIFLNVDIKRRITIFPCSLIGLIYKKKRKKKSSGIRMYTEFDKWN